MDFSNKKSRGLQIRSNIKPKTINIRTKIKKIESMNITDFQELLQFMRTIWFSTNAIPNNVCIHINVTSNAFKQIKREAGIRGANGLYKKYFNETVNENDMLIINHGIKFKIVNIENEKQRTKKRTSARNGVSPKKSGVHKKSARQDPKGRTSTKRARKRDEGIIASSYA